MTAQFAPVPPPGNESGGLVTPSPVGPKPPTNPILVAPVPTAQSAHTMLKAVGIELAFVVIATMLAGVSDQMASGMLALMLALLVLRGLFEVDVFAAFAQGTALHK